MPIRLARPARLSWRAVRLRCPQDGYQVGSYMFNIVAADLIFWPTPPWLALQIGGVALKIVAPFLFFPFSKTRFLAFDLFFRPATRDELR